MAFTIFRENNSKFIENCILASGILPLDLGTARDAPWIEIPLSKQLSIIFYKAAGTAGDDPTVRMQQAQDIAGTGAKDLTYTEYWIKQGADLSAIANFTKTTQNSASTSFNLTSAETQILAVFSFDYEKLDKANSFTHVRFRIDDVGINPMLGCALYLLTDVDVNELDQWVASKNGYWNGSSWVKDIADAKIFVSSTEAETELTAKGYDGTGIILIKRG